MKKEIIKPFDLEKAKAGAKLRTRDGKPVETFKWDARGAYPIRGIVIAEKDDIAADWALDGSWDCNHHPDSFDLVIVEEVEEPEFKVGDWVVYCNGDVGLITGIDENGYSLSNGGYIPFMCARDIRLWTIKDDAKAGDVLVASDGSIFIFASVDGCACKHYVALTTDGVININEGVEHYWETSKATYPAEKEQRDLLFQKMKEAGYKWDAEKLELKKIKPEFWSDNKSNTLNGFYINLNSDILKAVKVPNTVLHHDVFATKKQAKAALAMARISQIMANDIENFGGVVTDEEWANGWQAKYSIIRRCNKPCCALRYHDYEFLAFHTAQQRNLFLEKYPQLVKDYLMISDCAKLIKK